MAKTIGRNRNTYTDTYAPVPIQLNSTSWTLVSESVSGFAERVGFTSSNNSNSDFYILKQLPPDNNPRGIIQFRKTLYESPVDTVPVGPIYMMAKNGNPFVMFEEF
jgi:hypothetical protein